MTTDVPQFIGPNNYLYVTLEDKHGKERNFPIHFLVANTHVPNPKKFRFIKHKNGNIHDNSAENLEWCSYEEYKKSTKLVIVNHCYHCVTKNQLC